MTMLVSAITALHGLAATGILAYLGANLDRIQPLGAAGIGLPLIGGIVSFLMGLHRVRENFGSSRRRGLMPKSLVRESRTAPVERWAEILLRVEWEWNGDDSAETDDGVDAAEGRVSLARRKLDLAVDRASDILSMVDVHRESQEETMHILFGSAVCSGLSVLMTLLHAMSAAQPVVPSS